MNNPDFLTVEKLATQLCHESGGTWIRSGTKKNLWRRRAIALWHRARGEKAKR